MKQQKIKTIEEADEIISKMIDKFHKKAKKKIPNLASLKIKVRHKIFENE